MGLISQNVFSPLPRLSILSLPLSLYLSFYLSLSSPPILPSTFPRGRKKCAQILSLKNLPKLWILQEVGWLAMMWWLGSILLPAISPGLSSSSSSSTIPSSSPHPPSRPPPNSPPPLSAPPPSFFLHHPLGSRKLIMGLLCASGRLIFWLKLKSIILKFPKIANTAQVPPPSPPCIKMFHVLLPLKNLGHPICVLKLH